jgi:5-methylcytosine-specific restriction enzyme B
LPTTVAIDQAPDELAARLSTQDDVVDLTQQIDLLKELMERPGARGQGRLHLPDADAQLAEKLNMPQQWLQECVDLLRDRPQLIFYGPPGTGKTYVAQELGRHLASKGNVKLVQFHPAYSYEDFFEGYRPDVQSAGQIGYRLTPGPLRRIVDLANENRDAVYVLIIDEINRGNIAKIFGELYFLLEYRDESIDLMYSSGAFQLPKNVVIIGTMNTADRSIALVDSAMRRRFAFRALHPSEPPTSGVLREWLSKQGLPSDNADLLDVLNNKIDDDEFKIGPSYFMRPAVYKPGGLELTWESSIIPLLEEFHYGDRNVDVRATYDLEHLRKIVQKQQLASETSSDSAIDPG